MKLDREIVKVKHIQTYWKWPFGDKTSTGFTVQSVGLFKIGIKESIKGIYIDTY